ncbi:NADH-quinone oxidoreductase subunit NuoE [Zavarzinia aquatilis]|uniref:NADH-quinone oxidoreductase subunit NuoE n=1 Tax=Zavarzinia aquatilis TaxID=2211142 RepID=A0A317EK04_9PROT|nr:NADH-quinone oxidoreductase subunit NuoE [Zavarzinia aquatilis]PWR25575.1 NADH-quinone oxidoreductase subunit NuoE [Zavarzinia aquatilis]
MSHGVAPAGPFEQPASFEFSAENKAWADKIIARYPAGRQQSAIVPLLDIAQRQSGGWLPRAAMEYLAELLGMAVIRVYEVASFYTMFNMAPVGKHLVQVCTTTPCWLRGSDAVLAACKSRLGIDINQTTPDGQFSLMEVECLGACVNAPMIQVNDDFYEDLTAETTLKVLDALARGESPRTGPQIERQTSCPEGGPTTLTTFKAAGE